MITTIVPFSKKNPQKSGGRNNFAFIGSAAKYGGTVNKNSKSVSALLKENAKLKEKIKKLTAELKLAKQKKKVVKKNTNNVKYPVVAYKRRKDGTIDLSARWCWNNGWKLGRRNPFNGKYLSMRSNGSPFWSTKKP